MHLLHVVEESVYESVEIQTILINVVSFQLKLKSYSSIVISFEIFTSLIDKHVPDRIFNGN